MSVKTLNFEIPLTKYMSSNAIEFVTEDNWKDAQRRLGRITSELTSLGIYVKPELQFSITDKITGTYKIIEGKPRCFLLMGCCFDIDTGYMLLTNRVIEDPIVMFSLKEVLAQYNADISWESFIANVEKYKLNITDTSFNPFEDIMGSKAGSLLKQLLMESKAKTEVVGGNKILVDVCEIVSNYQRFFSDLWDSRDYATPDSSLSDDTCLLLNKLTTAKHQPGLRYNINKMQEFSTTPTDVNTEYLMNRLTSVSSLTSFDDPKSLRILDGVFEVIRANSQEEADNFMYNAMVSPDNLKQIAKSNKVAKEVLKGSVLSGLVKKYNDTVGLLVAKDTESSTGDFYLSYYRDNTVSYDNLVFNKYDKFIDNALRIFKAYL